MGCKFCERELCDTDCYQCSRGFDLPPRPTAHELRESGRRLGVADRPAILDETPVLEQALRVADTYRDALATLLDAFPDLAKSYCTPLQQMALQKARELLT